MWKLALRNITRQKVRSGLTLLAIAIGVAALILTGGFVQDIFIQLREFTIHSQTGHIQVNKKGYYLHGAQQPTKYLIEDIGPVRRITSEIEEVEDVLSRLRFSGLLSTGRSDSAIVGEGVEPAKEQRLGSYLNIIAGRQLEDKDKFGIVVGEGVASSQRLSPGDHVNLLINTKDGALNSLEFEVVGVFRTFSKEYDARAVRIALSAAQELLLSRGVNSVVVSLNDSDSTKRVVQRILPDLEQQGFEVKTWDQLNDFYRKTVDLYQRQFAVLQLVVLGMVVLGVANSVNMSVLERVGEFGTMMALGDRRATVRRLILLENSMLAVTSAFAGVIAGVGLALLISWIGITMPPPPNSNVGYTAVIRLVPGTIAASFTIGVLATLTATLLPALRVSKKTVVDALRHNV
jgi:putative ABC transport system permease protein